MHRCVNFILPLYVLLQGKNSLGLMWWFLCREVLRLRGSISRELPWEIMPDLFFYRDPEEVCVCVCVCVCTHVWCVWLCVCMSAYVRVCSSRSC